MVNENFKKSAELMLSPDYKKRFIAELKERCESLKTMLDKYITETLDYVPSCSIVMLSGQLAYMESYLNVLEERAKIEGISL